MSATAPHFPCSAITPASDTHGDVPGSSTPDAQEKLVVDAERLEEKMDVVFLKFDDMSFSRVSLILLSLGLASFLYAIEQTIVATSVAGIGNALNVKGSLTWVTTSYLLTTTVLQPIAGRVSDAVGAKRLLIIEVWIFILGNIIAGTSKGITQLVAGRLISGVGGAGLLSLSTIIVSQLTNDRQRSSYLNLVNVIFTVADAIGPIVGGAFLKSGNWRWIFLFTAPFGPFITLIVLKAIKLPPQSSQVSSFRGTLAKMDLLGMTMLIFTLTFLIMALNLGGQAFAWSSPTIIGMFCAAAISFLAFIIAEKYAQLPVAPMELFVQWRWRNVPLMLVSRTLLFFHLFANTFYLPILLQVIGISNINSAALVIPFLLISSISSAIVNIVNTKIGYVRFFFISILSILPIGMGLMSTLNETSSLGQIVGYSLICGIGYGGGTQTSLVIAQVGLPPDTLSTVTALIGSAPNLGGVLGVGIIGTIINNMFHKTIAQALPSTSGLNLNDVVGVIGQFPPGETRSLVVRAYIRAWRVGYWTLAGIAVVQLLLCLLLRPVEFEEQVGQVEGAVVGVGVFGEVADAPGGENRQGLEKE